MPFLRHDICKPDFSGGKRALEEQVPTNYKMDFNMTTDVIDDVLYYIDAKSKLGDYELFLDNNSDPYLTFTSENGAKQNWPLQSKQVEAQLMKIANYHRSAILTDKMVKQCLDVLYPRAMVNGKTYPTAYRIGCYENAYYLDLCNSGWQYLKMTCDGWSIVDDSPVKFLRNENLRPLPIPSKNGDLNDIWPFLNIDNDDKLLVTAWLLEALRVDTQMPLLEFNGYKGTGKSQTTLFIRNTFDPNKAPLRATPNKVDDLYISSQYSAVLVFENVSFLKSDIQDAMCQLVTGSGYAKRTMYTNLGETVISVRKPVVINGINKLITRTDLIERSVFFQLQEIASSARKSESEFIQEFELKHASILGGLADLFCQVLKALPDCQPKRLPRLADFGRLGQVLCDIQGEPTPFIEILKENQDKGTFEALDDQPTLQVLISFIHKEKKFQGSYKSLLDRLHQHDKNTLIVKSAKKLSILIKTWEAELTTVGLMLNFEPKRRRDGFHLTISLDGSDVHNVHNVHQASNIDEKADVEYASPETAEFFNGKPVNKQH